MGKCRYCGKSMGFLRSRHAECEELQAVQAQKWMQGYVAFKEGEKHYLEKRSLEAVECFDKAIECGFEQETSIYFMRGSCLQELDWNLDAIDDFSKAISLEPQDCNNYFMRALSKGATGDSAGCIADLQEAIRMSKVENSTNEEYCLGAKNMGWPSHTAMYEAQILFHSPSSAEHIDKIMREKKIERARLRGRRNRDI